MMSRLAAILLTFVLVVTAAAAEVRTVKIAYVDRAGDPFYAHREGYGGIYDATRQPAVSGAELGVKDARIIGRATGVTFQLLRATVPEGAAAAEFVRQLMQRENPAAAILDLPEADVEAVAAALGRDSIPLFNIRHRGGGLRQKTCGMRLFHVMPSDAMLHDALAQYLKLVGWDEILVLASDSAADLAQSESFQASARKFGLSFSDVRQFVHGNDPRQRDLNNVRLLTGGAAYDAVFVADETHEFARLLPYRTVRPRPVVGATGLSPLAWHPQWERHGAPQLNRRFFKFAGRTMTEEDWAAWVAVKAIVEAGVKAGYSGGPLADELLKPELTLELYKGFPGSFRPWDRQLRQSILLGTADAVIGLAPVEGALHQFNNLDTLGLDEPEFHCPG
ncbi:MAG: ABC transporter substrate-binding protein [Hyphomicrobiales bacterium]